jgi:hypothetical protein
MENNIIWLFDLSSQQFLNQKLGCPMSSDYAVKKLNFYI